MAKKKSVSATVPEQKVSKVSVVMLQKSWDSEPVEVFRGTLKDAQQYLELQQVGKFTLR